jgi:hypothetical protein
MKIVYWKTIYSFAAAIYIWSLPLLRYTGFTTSGRSEDGKAYSISMFISTT